MVSWVAKSWLGAFEGRLRQQIFVEGEKRCFKHKTESETDILHAFLWVTAWSGIDLKRILLLLCLHRGRTNQKGPANNSCTASIQSCLMWIQAEHTGEHPQIMCSAFKETTMSLLLSSTPTSAKAACYEGTRNMGLGGRQRPRFNPPWLAVRSWVSC